MESYIWLKFNETGKKGQVPIMDCKISVNSNNSYPLLG